MYRLDAVPRYVLVLPVMNLDWALFYAARGWAVLPLHYSEDGQLCCICGKVVGYGETLCSLKIPILQHGSKDASTDQAQIRAWWTKHPHANIGIATGAVSGLFVVDLDDKEGRCGTENWQALADAAGGDGQPFEAETGSGGLHLVYSLADQELANSAGKLGHGIDTRGKGGYIVAAPSLHYSGNRYKWTGGRPPSEAPGLVPAWVAEKLAARKMVDAAPVELRGGYVLTRADLEEYIKFKGRFEDAKRHVDVARSVLDGTSWGKGSRHSSMVSFLGSLRTWVADHRGSQIDPEGSGALFDGCTAAATAEGVSSPTDRHWIAGLIRTLQAGDAEFRGALEATRAQKKAVDDEFAAAISAAVTTSTGQTDVFDECIQRAFGTDRTDPYSDEELRAMHPISKRWILATPAGYFLRAPGGDYVQVIEKAVQVKARDLLAPAATADVLLKEPDSKGEMKLKSVAQLLDQYGQAPTHTAYSYIVPRSTLDGNTFIQRVGVPLEHKPERNEQVAKWFELFAGEQLEPLLDWLATLTRVERPTCAVCIMGTSGAGKDLFVEGVAEIWGGQRLSFERAVSNFNHSLISSPLVVANEEVRTPPHYGGGAADALKEMISDVKRMVEAKYAQPVPLHGSLRVVLATNANGVLKFDRQPTPSDIVALDERILLLRPSDACKDYLNELGGRETTEAWVAGGAIAKHIAWLAQNRVVKPGPRFLVQGRGGMSDLLSADGRGSAVVLRAIISALLGPMQVNERVACFDSGDVWVSLGGLKREWPTYGGKDVPEDLGAVFDAICERNSSASKRMGGEVVRARKLKWPVILRAAEKEGRLEELLGLRA